MIVTMYSIMSRFLEHSTTINGLSKRTYYITAKYISSRLYFRHKSSTDRFRAKTQTPHRQHPVWFYRQSTWVVRSMRCLNLSNVSAFFPFWPFARFTGLNLHENRRSFSKMKIFKRGLAKVLLTMYSFRNHRPEI